MTTLAIIQARYGSTRLPGKVLAPIGEWAALEHVVRRTALAVADLVVAVPSAPRDARVYAFAKEKLHVPVFMWDGPEDDVLGRYTACAREHKASTIVRITADCPLIDPDMISAVLVVQNRTGVPYVSNVPPRYQVDGLDVEVFSRDLLEQADAEAVSPGDREHVTPWMRRQTHTVLVDRRLPLPFPDAIHRWTLDTPGDLAWMQELAKWLDLSPSRPVTWDMVALMAADPAYVRLHDAISYQVVPI